MVAFTNDFSEFSPFQKFASVMMVEKATSRNTHTNVETVVEKSTLPLYSQVGGHFIGCTLLVRGDR